MSPKISYFVDKLGHDRLFTHLKDTLMVRTRKAFEFQICTFLRAWIRTGALKCCWNPRLHSTRVLNRVGGGNNQYFKKHPFWNNKYIALQLSNKPLKRTACKLCKISCVNVSSNNNNVPQTFERRCWSMQVYYTLHFPPLYFPTAI